MPQETPPSSKPVLKTDAKFILFNFHLINAKSECP